jgi:excisionase family DNA binding protein
MTAPRPSRAELVAQCLAELRPQVRRVLGVNVIGDALIGEWLAMVTLVAEEFAPRSQQLSARAEAMCRLLHECVGERRARATTEAFAVLDVLVLEPDVDISTAAELLDGMKKDTLRKHLRRNRIKGTRVNGKWRISLAAIDDYRACRAS